MSPYKGKIYVELLQEVRQELARRGEGAICGAIMRAAAGRGHRAGHAADQLRNWVMDMLGGYGYYERWLRSQRGTFQRRHHICESFHLDNGRSANKGRLQWLDWMIEQVKP